MRSHNERYCRELRRFNLALRMVAQNARTRTVRNWTGWSKPRVQNTTRGYWAGHATRVRLSGPSPSDLKRFWQSRHLQREAAALAGLYRLLGFLPPEGTVLDVLRLPDLERGEELCLAYEIFLTFVPQPRISFEHASLLATALASGTDIVPARCVECENLVLIERLDPRPRCTYCQR